MAAPTNRARETRFTRGWRVAVSVLVAMLIPGAVGLVVSVLIAWAAVMFAGLPKDVQVVARRESFSPWLTWSRAEIGDRYRFASRLWVETYPGLTIYRVWYDRPQYEHLTYRAGFPFRCLEGRTIAHVTVDAAGQLQQLPVAWQDRIRQGIPLPAWLSFTPYGVHNLMAPAPRALPLVPRWPQLLLNVIIIGGAWRVLMSLAWSARERVRRRRGRCIWCGHPLAGTERCAECGAPIAGEAPHVRLRRVKAVAGWWRQSRAWHKLLVGGAISLVAGAVVTIMVALGIAFSCPEALMLPPRGSGSGVVGSEDRTWLVTTRGATGIHRVTIERIRFQAHSAKRDQATIGQPLESLIPSWAELTELPAGVDGTGGVAAACAVGWPQLSMCGTIELVDHEIQHGGRVVVHGAAVADQSTRADWGGVMLARIIPFQPLWPGFAVNTLLYGGILWSVFATIVIVRSRRGSDRSAERTRPGSTPS